MAMINTDSFSSMPVMQISWDLCIPIGKSYKEKNCNKTYVQELKQRLKVPLGATIEYHTKENIAFLLYRDIKASVM